MSVRDTHLCCHWMEECSSVWRADNREVVSHRKADFQISLSTRKGPKLVDVVIGNQKLTWVNVIMLLDWTILTNITIYFFIVFCAVQRLRVHHKIGRILLLLNELSSRASTFKCPSFLLVWRVHKKFDLVQSLGSTKSDCAESEILSFQFSRNKVFKLFKAILFYSFLTFDNLVQGKYLQ